MSGKHADAPRTPPAPATEANIDQLEAGRIAVAPGAPSTVVSTWLSVLAFLGAVGAVVFFGAISKDAVVLGEVLTFFLATFLVFRFPAITKFKALGVEVEVARAKEATREAQRAAEEAMATAAQLRAVGATLGKAALDIVAVSGRFGGSFRLPEKALIRDDILKSLSQAGCSEDQLGNARLLLDRTLHFDLANRVLKLAGLQPKAEDPTYSKSKNELIGLDEHGSWAVDRERFSAPGADRLREFLAERDLDDKSVLRRLEEYERFEKTGELPDTRKDDDEERQMRRQPRGR